MKISQKRQSNIIICMAWVLIFASTPLYKYYAKLSIGEEFNWNALLDAWSFHVCFLVLFLINHYVLIPRHILRKRIKRYVVCIVLSLVVFTAFLSWIEHRNHPFHSHVRIPSENKTAMVPNEQYGPEFPPIDDLDSEFIYKDQVGPGFPPDEGLDPEFPSKDQANPEFMPKGKMYSGFSPLLPPPVLAGLIIGILMVGVDLGLVAWLNEQKMRHRLLMLEQQSIKQELDQLRYQINPHFFMNILNNIHALVDIDPERAKRVIVELSGLMRYVLYEGGNVKVSLNREMEFLRLYVSLMRLRYSEKVEISFSVPDNVSEKVLVPPLLLVTFVENAFKHGISYKNKSFIYVKIWLEEGENIHFQCLNSRHASAEATSDTGHGIGMSNVRKRLELIYANRYVLTVNNANKQIYGIDLILPAT